MTKTLKTAVMMVITLLATLIAQHGMPANKTAWIIALISIGGTTLVYIGKNTVFPSISIFGSINLGDLVSGLIMAIGSGLFNWVGQLAADVPINWYDLKNYMISVVIMYLVSKFATGQTDPDNPALPAPKKSR